jgi:hypothetical protein
MRPDSVIILGITYKIEYVDKPSDVDIYKRDSMWGQIDYWTRSIRIYANGLSEEDTFSTVMHEVLHGVANAFKLKALQDDDNHDELDLLALALTDVLYRNRWIKTERPTA